MRRKRDTGRKSGPFVGTGQNRPRKEKTQACPVDPFRDSGSASWRRRPLLRWTARITDIDRDGDSTRYTDEELISRDLSHRTRTGTRLYARGSGKIRKSTQDIPFVERYQVTGHRASIRPGSPYMKRAWRAVVEYMGSVSCTFDRDGNRGGELRAAGSGGPADHRAFTFQNVVTV